MRKNSTVCRSARMSTLNWMQSMETHVKLNVARLKVSHLGCRKLDFFSVNDQSECRDARRSIYFPNAKHRQPMSEIPNRIFRFLVSKNSRWRTNGEFLCIRGRLRGVSKKCENAENDFYIWTLSYFRKAEIKV